jgi:hypothetical protein
MVGSIFSDLIRIGVYSQLEGNTFIRKPKPPLINIDYRFGFSTNQISDMNELINRILGREINEGSRKGRLQFSSKELHDKLIDLGFKKFHSDDWNVPTITVWGFEGQKEYLRAIIDSIGNVDIDRGQPYIALSNVNKIGVLKLQKMFGGKFRVEVRKNGFTTYRINWRGRKAIELLNFLDWRFYNHRNIRGAELIRVVRWEDYGI